MLKFSMANAQLRHIKLAIHFKYGICGHPTCTETQFGSKSSMVTDLYMAEMTHTMQQVVHLYALLLSASLNTFVIKSFMQTFIVHA